MVRFALVLTLLCLPALVSAQEMPLEVLQREAVEASGPEDGPKPASSMFTNISLGRAGHASWSLLIPGWSQYRAGNNGRALLFAGIEATIWSVFAVSKAQESSREDTYQSFAQNFAGVGSTDQDDDYWSAVGKYKDTEEYNERVPVLREELLEAQGKLRKANFPVIVLFAGVVFSERFLDPALVERARGAFLAGADWRLRQMRAHPFPDPRDPRRYARLEERLLALAEGNSVITEKIYPDRFMHVAELQRMGADIELQGHTAIVRGRERLQGAPVMATDLRASACLIIAALAADGDTTIDRVYHLDRGYANIDRKLAEMGAIIQRI